MTPTTQAMTAEPMTHQTREDSETIAIKKVSEYMLRGRAYVVRNARDLVNACGNDELALAVGNSYVILIDSDKKEETLKERIKWEEANPGEIMIYTSVAKSRDMLDAMGVAVQR